MKRSLFVVCIILHASLLYPQTDSFDIFLQNGKAEFKKAFAGQNFDSAVVYLEKAVALKPEDPEVHYFLGYAYSRLNSKDGKGMISMSLDLTFKSSGQFELVNKLSPKYEGEIIVLDPYSKLSSEWGSMAMSYWHNNKKDSAIWAFKEGKKRSGFGELYLNVARMSLDRCKYGSILISSGDNCTIPLWYVQIVEGYRKDIAVVDVSLLNTTWYPRFLSSSGAVRFNMDEVTLDTIEYSPWTDSIISIPDAGTGGDFLWMVKPGYYEYYILRGDRILLSLLSANRFEREIYFTNAFDENSRLGLKGYLRHLIVIDRLNHNKQEDLTAAEYRAELNKILTAILPSVNRNSAQEALFADNLRLDIIRQINESVQESDTKEIKALLKLMDRHFDEKKFPYTSAELKGYIDTVRKLE